MQATIPAQSLRLLSRVLQCMLKIGDEVAIEAQASRLRLSTLNSARSAFALFTFSRAFFDKYTVDSSLIQPDGPESDRSPGSSKSGGGGATTAAAAASISCRVLLKSLVSIFKQRSELDRSVESCEIRLEQSVHVGDECRLVIHMKCRHGISKTYRLFYEPCDPLYAIYDKNACPNKVIVSPDVITEWIQHFHPKLEEMTMFCLRESLELHSYKGALAKYLEQEQSKQQHQHQAMSVQRSSAASASKGHPLSSASSTPLNSAQARIQKQEQVATPQTPTSKAAAAAKNAVAALDRENAKQPMKTVVTLDVDEFDTYQVQFPAELTFSLREYKAALAFAQVNNLAMSLHFEAGGRPLLIALKTADHVEGDFVLATLPDPTTSAGDNDVGSETNSQASMMSGGAVSQQHSQVSNFTPQQQMQHSNRSQRYSATAASATSAASASAAGSNHRTPNISQSSVLSDGLTPPQYRPQPPQPAPPARPRADFGQSPEFGYPYNHAADPSPSEPRSTGVPHSGPSATAASADDELPSSIAITTPRTDVIFQGQRPYRIQARSHTNGASTPVGQAAQLLKANSVATTTSTQSVIGIGDDRFVNAAGAAAMRYPPANVQANSYDDDDDDDEDGDEAEMGPTPPSSPHKKRKMLIGDEEY
ncbi:hypothetical protein GQ42DRAFT_160765 [Ramicandelaber brevisporus]|nr:hypothetical protein GQ42DRAFT_160765 [Ramicandelaber brevisporus]